MTPAVVDRLAEAHASLHERVRKERASLAALAKVEPVRVEDWTLYASGEAHLVRDLDIAERAELKVYRDIRRTVQQAAKDRLLTIVGGDRDGLQGPYAVAMREMVSIGSGASRETTVYYLSEEAALLLVTRLRTPKAIELTKAIVRVFLAVTRSDVARLLSRLRAAWSDEHSRPHEGRARPRRSQRGRARRTEGLPREPAGAGARGACV